MPENQLGPYRLLRELGRGGMGEVWEAERLEGPAGKVALKTLSAGSHPVAALRKLMDEALLVSLLEHPNIVRTLDAGVSEGRCYFAMELLEGMTVAQLVARGEPVPVPAVLSLGRQVLAALAHIQNATGPSGEALRVVHRDVKPSNVFVTWAGQVKLIDFGIAQARLLDATQTRTGDFRGSLAYASPEQVRGEKQDVRGDLFSLGLILHELLTGSRVFAEKNEAALVGALLWRPIMPVHTVNESVPLPVSKALGWALERDLAQRAPTPAALAEAWEKASQGQPTWNDQELSAWLSQLRTNAPVQSPDTAQIYLPALRSTPLPLPVEAAGPLRPPPLPQRLQAPVRPPAKRWPRWVGLGLGVLVAGGAFFAWRGEGPSPTPSARPFKPELTPVVQAAPVRPVAPVEPVLETPLPEPTPAPVAPSRRRPSKSASVRRGKTLAASAKAVEEGAFITVDARPTWARIQVDGRELGVTPLVRIPLAPGRRHLVAFREDGKRMEREVLLKRGLEERVLLLW